jgi:hypothetical protein
VLSSSMRMKRIGVAALAAGVLAVAGMPAAVADGATVVRSELSAFATVPCALGGVGEEVLVEGTALTVVRQESDAAGGTHFVLHTNYDSLVGTGLTSGTTYHAVATENETSHNFQPFVGPPYSFTFTQHVRFIGQGPGNDFIIADTAHVTVNAEGVATAEHEDFRVDCR